MKKNCPCAGLNPDCNQCFGKGYYEDKESDPLNLTVFQKGEKNGASVENDRLKNNLKTVHNVLSDKPVKHKNHKHKTPFYKLRCVEINSPVETDKPDKITRKSYRTVLNKPNVKNPIPQHQTKKLNNGNKIKIALLAPVKESYLETAVRDIYPKYKKVSFGSNMKKGEMVNIQKYVKLHRNINVYLFYQNFVRYKAILTDEFYIFSSTRIHPKPWGSWNDDFSSYYTVTNIKPFKRPVTDFTYSSTKNKIEFSPHKPSWVYDIS